MAEKLKSVLKFKFAEKFDGRLPPHWAILIRTAAAPFPLIQLFDSPLAPNEVLRARVLRFEDESFFDFEGTIPADDPKNKLGVPIIIETIEKDIETEILEDTEKTMRVRFGGLLLNGLLAIDNELGNATWEEGGPMKAETKEAKKTKRARRKSRGRQYTSVSELLESGAHEDAVQVASDIEDFLKAIAEAVYRVTHDDKEKYFGTRGEADAYASTYADAKIERLPELPEGKVLESQLEEVFRVTYSGKTKYFRRGAAARAYAEKNPGATVTKIDKLPDGARFEEATMAPEGKVYRVLWADGRGVQYFDNLEAAEEFSRQKGRDGGKPTLIDKPAGAKVKSKAPAIEESNETLLEAEKESIPDPEATGRHAHPHASDGVHQHEGVGEGGGHEHNLETFGGHRHDGKDGQLDGQHLNVGDAPHNHLIELGLTEYIEWSAKVHMTHPWIEGYTGARIRHLKPTPEAEAREATLEDWKEHTIWWMHSTGLASAIAHNAVFLDKETAIIEKTYMLKDGTERAPTEEDFQAEVLWFTQNTPPELARKLLEARVIESMSMELDDENKKVIASIPATTLEKSEG